MVVNLDSYIILPSRIVSSNHASAWPICVKFTMMNVFKINRDPVSKAPVCTLWQVCVLIFIDSYLSVLTSSNTAEQSLITALLVNTKNIKTSLLM